MATTTIPTPQSMTTLVKTIIRAAPGNGLTTVVIGAQGTAQAIPNFSSLWLPSIQPWVPSSVAVAPATTLLTVTTATLASPSRSSTTASGSDSSSNSGTTSSTASEASIANETATAMASLQSGGLSTGAKAGLGVGLAVGLIGLALLAVVFYRKWQAHKAQKKTHISVIYRAPPRGKPSSGPIRDSTLRPSLEKAALTSSAFQSDQGMSNIKYAPGAMSVTAQSSPTKSARKLHVVPNAPDPEIFLSPTATELRDLNAMPTPEGGRISVWSPTATELSADSHHPLQSHRNVNHFDNGISFSTPTRVRTEMVPTRPKSREEIGNFPHPATLMTGDTGAAAKMYSSLQDTVKTVVKNGAGNSYMKPQAQRTQPRGLDHIGARQQSTSRPPTREQDHPERSSSRPPIHEQTRAESPSRARARASSMAQPLHLRAASVGRGQISPPFPEQGESNPSGNAEQIQPHAQTVDWASYPAQKATSFDYPRPPNSEFDSQQWTEDSISAGSGFAFDELEEVRRLRQESIKRHRSEEKAEQDRLDSVRCVNSIANAGMHKTSGAAVAVEHTPLMDEQGLPQRPCARAPSGSNGQPKMVRFGESRQQHNANSYNNSANVLAFNPNFSFNANPSSTLPNGNPNQSRANAFDPRRTPSPGTVLRHPYTTNAANRSPSPATMLNRPPSAGFQSRRTPSPGTMPSGPQNTNPLHMQNLMSERARTPSGMGMNAPGVSREARRMPSIEMTREINARGASGYISAEMAMGAAWWDGEFQG